MGRIRIDKETPEHQSRTDHETWREYFLNPTDIGGLFTRAAIIFGFVLLPISMLITAGAIASGRGEIAILFFLFCLTGTSMSMLGYTAWSFSKQRQLRKQRSNGNETHLLVRPIRAVKIAFTDGSELNEYEGRIQNTVLGLITSIILGYIPIRIFSSILLAYLSLA